MLDRGRIDLARRVRRADLRGRRRQPHGLAQRRLAVAMKHDEAIIGGYLIGNLGDFCAENPAKLRRLFR